ncbi:MAG: BatD family protein [Crocinitomicaceae bacterium]|jgi:hypothetical protein|nr:BatD family protein [Crocinitomicaceae bacterium]
MMKYLLLFTGFILLGFSPVSYGVEAKANKKNVQVGEQFQVKFEIQIASNKTVVFQPEKTVLKAVRTNRSTNKQYTIELDVTGFFLEERDKIQGKEYWIGTYTLTSFEEGIIVIPKFKFNVNGKALSSNPVMIFVDLMPVDKKVDLHDIEENFIELKVPFFEKYERIIWWLVLIAVLGILVAAYFLFLKKMKPEKAEEEIVLTTNERRGVAIAQLTALMEKELWAKDELKQHFTELSLIVRRYISKEMGTSYLEKTSLEIQLFLRKKGYREGLIKPLGLILNVSDMVKFAKSSVEKEGVFKVYQDAKSFIEEFEKN